MTTIGSLFSGAGGLDLAVEDVFDAHLAWQCETDPSAAKVLATHWPHVINHGDVTTIDWDTAVTKVDILCGGYPCQPFSTAGRRKGSNDERHLWPHFLRAIRHLRPRLVILENVAGHRTLGFDRVLGDLAEIRFNAEWVSIRASDIGAPHGRERLFVVAYPDHRGPQRDTNHARGRESDTARRDLRIQSERRGSTLAHADSGRCEVRAQRDLEQTYRLETPRGHDTNRRALEPSRADRRTDWGQYSRAIAHWERLTRPAPAPAEPNTAGRPRIRPEFSEWLMGWPAGWVTDVPGISRTNQLRIIGNGVCTHQATAALLSLRHRTEEDHD